MKGVILAGGTGSRLDPLTKVTNKHLLNIFNKPMIYFPIETLKNAGIKEILIISGPGHAGDFVNLLGSGREFKLRFSYEVQDEALGIAHAIGLAEDFADNENIIVILGDNIFEDNVKNAVEKFNKAKEGAHIFLKEVPDANRFGVAEVEGDKIKNIEEKPKKPKSNLAVTGLYMYDSKVFNYIKTLRPSGRGELEVTDLNNIYIKKNQMRFTILKGFWSDAGTFESLFRASKLVREKLLKK